MPPHFQPVLIFSGKIPEKTPPNILEKNGLVLWKNFFRSFLPQLLLIRKYSA